MVDLAKSYCDNVIKPIEDMRYELLSKIYSKNIFHIINRKFYKEQLEKLDKLWFDKLVKLETYIDE